MKHLALRAILLAGIAVAFATPASATVLGSKHDLSTAGIAIKGTNTQTCVYCHTPHQANTGLVGAPLWNHATPAATYTLYTNTSGSLQSTVAQPGATSKACLSCHDGALSVGALLNLNGAPATDTMTDVAGGATYTAGVMQAGTAFMVGTDLSNDHPVGFLVTAANITADGQLQALAAMKTAGMVFFGATQDAMECATCHDAHGTANTYMLRASATGSAICTACHIK